VTHKPYLVGITGGIGSGKSLVTRIFQCLGIKTYDADSRAKNIMTTDGILVQQIKKEFGNLSYNGELLNRQFLAEEVFNKPERLKILESLVHPRVKIDFENWVKANSEEQYLLKEAALLMESASGQELDKLVVVSAPMELRIKRVLERDKQRNREDVLHIISNQLSEEEKMKRADHIIHNDETVLLIPQVLSLHKLFAVASQN
jgi:dephospho-CoA kinase